MYYIGTIFVLYLLTTATASTLFRRITSRETNNCDDRRTPGPICESCELLATCVRHSDGWVNIPTELCDTQSGFFCNAQLGMCSNSTGSCHPFNFEGQFPCTSQGIFPDPYDCQKYHMCYFVGGTLVAASVECGGDKAFNAANGQCTLSLADPVCTNKQFDCQHVGDVHSWPGNSNIFYICKASSSETERVLYPALYRCADGEHFDGSYCRQTTGPNPPATSSPFHPTDIPLTTTSCTSAGLLPDPENCRKYYYCSGVNGTRRHLDCPPGTIYSVGTASCTQGQC